ncbi:MAG TPA: DUF4097 family beta strand repeat-containing protein [Ktedonobacteraceae bacterium]|nr:DUF4097 family beta strand repeat-containing protein [Ktedonobacteraceae bacterium]
MINQEVGRTGTEERPVEQPQVAETPQQVMQIPPERPVEQATPLPQYAPERPYEQASPPPQYPPERPVEQATPPPQYRPYGEQNYYPAPGQPPYNRPYYGPPYPPRYRRHRAWPWIILGVFLILLFAWLIGLPFRIGGFNYSFYTNSVTDAPRHFAVSTNPIVVINNDIGSIHVQSGGTVSDVMIQATRHAGFGGNVNDVQVAYAQNSAANTITVNVDRTSNATIINSASVDFQVTVPSNATLELKTNTGGLDVTGVSGRMTVRSNTGSVEVRDGTLSSGSLLSTNTGSITFNGSIGQTGPYQFTTNTGSINVTLPSGSSFHLDASTDTGSITSDFPGVYVQHQNFTGAVSHSDVGSSPQATVTMTTNTGSINLQES